MRRLLAAGLVFAVLASVGCSKPQPTGTPADEAQAEFRRALELSPGNAEVKAAMEQQ